MSVEVKERPIIFNAEMVRAVLDGRKTQTRRPLMKQPTAEFMSRGISSIQPQWPQQDGVRWFMCDGLSELMSCPYGAPGDRLWVRETIFWFDAMTDDTYNLAINYSAQEEKNHTKPPVGWKPPKRQVIPSIHMPRWASRILLEITDIRVERVQDISEADSEKEGIYDVPFRPDDGFPICIGYMSGPDDGKTGLETSAKKAFMKLWQAIYGHDAWERNDWVWVVEFKRIDTEQQPKAVNS